MILSCLLHIFFEWTFVFLPNFTWVHKSPQLSSGPLPGDDVVPRTKQIKGNYAGVRQYCDLIYKWWAWGMKWEHWCTLRRKSTSEHLFWCFSLSQIGDSCQYLEGPISTWKHHDRDIGVHLSYMVLTNMLIYWSFQVLTWVPYLWQAEAPKKVLGSTLCP